MPKKILIVDDEELVLKSIDRLLKKAGYEVVVARNGTHAVEEVKKSDFDLIVSDIRMPGVDWVQMIKEIRALLDTQGRKKIPEIFITGYANEETSKQAESLKVA